MGSMGMVQTPDRENRPYFTPDPGPSKDGPGPAAIHPGRFTTGLILVLCLVLGMPVLWIHMTTPPEDAALVTVLTIPYYDLYHIFLLTAVTLIVSSLVLIPLGPATGAGLFCLSLFCAFPLILGLRHNLELSRLIRTVEFFSSWPFFLHPAWLLSQVLFPAGILIFLFLYFRALFVKKRHSSAYFFSVVLVCSAAFLSLSALARAGHPTLLSLAHTADKLPLHAITQPPDSTILETPKEIPAAQPVPAEAGAAATQIITDKASPRSIQAAQPDPDMAAAREVRALEAIENRLKILSSRMDYFSARLDAMEAELADQDNKKTGNSHKPEQIGDTSDGKRL